MNLRQLQYLVAVADEGGVRAAARKIYVAQPPLSQALQQLETELGVTLFERSRRGMVPTEAGRDFIGRARDILQRVERAKVTARSAPVPTGASLRVGAVAGLIAAGELTGPILAAFRAERPDVSLSVHDVDFSEQVDFVTNGLVDVALVRYPIREGGVTTVPLAAEPRVLLVSSSHEFADASSMEIGAIIDEPMLDISAPEEFTDFWHLKPERGYPLIDKGLSPVATVQGIHLSLTTSPVIVVGCSSMARLAPSPLIRAIPLPEASPSVIGLAYRRGDSRPLIRQFIDTAAAAVSNHLSLLPGATSRL